MDIDKITNIVINRIRRDIPKKAIIKHNFIPLNSETETETIADMDHDLIYEKKIAKFRKYASQPTDKLNIDDLDHLAIDQCRFTDVFNKHLTQYDKKNIWNDNNNKEHIYGVWISKGKIALDNQLHNQRSTNFSARHAAYIFYASLKYLQNNNLELLEYAGPFLKKDSRAKFIFTVRYATFVAKMHVKGINDFFYHYIYDIPTDTLYHNYHRLQNITSDINKLGCAETHLKWYKNLYQIETYLLEHNFIQKKFIVHNTNDVYGKLFFLSNFSAGSTSKIFFTKIKCRCINNKSVYVAINIVGNYKITLSTHDYRDDDFDFDDEYEDLNEFYWTEDLTYCFRYDPNVEEHFGNKINAFYVKLDELINGPKIRIKYQSPFRKITKFCRKYSRYLKQNRSFDVSINISYNIGSYSDYDSCDVYLKIKFENDGITTLLQVFYDMLKSDFGVGLNIYYDVAETTGTCADGIDVHKTNIKHVSSLGRVISDAEKSIDRIIQELVGEFDQLS